jgi:hypothetical protein
MREDLVFAGLATPGRRHRTELREYLVSYRDTVIDWIVLAD